MAIESLLIEKRLISAEEVDHVISNFVSDIGPMYGAKVIARAWVDPAYKQRLLQDGNKALAEMGFGDVVEHLASAVYIQRFDRPGKYPCHASCRGLYALLLLPVESLRLTADVV